MSDEQLKCEQRIDGQLESRLEEMRISLGQGEKKYHHDCEVCGQYWESDEELERCPNLECESDDWVVGEEDDNSDNGLPEPLDIEKRIVFQVNLSTGGPQDYFSVFVDSDGDIERIEYHFLDWFDGATRVLSGSDFDVAEEMFRQMLDYELDEIKSANRRR